MGSLRQTQFSSSQFCHGPSFVVLIALMSQSTQSIHLCFSLPLFLLPGGTTSRVFRPTYSWSRLFTCPNHLGLAFLHISVIFSTFSLSLELSFLTWCVAKRPFTLFIDRIYWSTNFIHNVLSLYDSQFYQPLNLYCILNFLNTLEQSFFGV